MKNIMLINHWVPQQCLTPYMDKFEFICPNKDAGMFSREELLREIPHCNSFYVLRMNVDSELIESGKKLKAIAHHAVGYDNIDIQCCSKKGIAVVVCPTQVTEATAELAIALMMAVMRNVLKYDRELRNNIWISGPWIDTDSQIFGHSVGIIGFGRIGKAFAKKAKGLGMNIYYYDPNRATPEIEEEYNAEYLPMDELLATCDCITLHLPYTKESHHLFNDSTFSKMKKGSFLINAARGAVVDEFALIRALQNGILKGAGLDVFEFEPKIPKELLSMDNVVMTPHAGSQTLETRINMWREGMSGVIAVLNGETPYNVINKEALNR